ncbi:Ribosome biogenesis protein Alb1 [Penicillium italicum]|uniref:Ribosome biogenesis protein Alb1 n=1 Tax=Penicillium italicum TaxID=40296 RepID=A0A0A2LGN5_PENIT|nr:Ribosome biogenesis protein Alb1 [Penicillium italicum]
MAKSKNQSQRSRAARRAASPSLDLDKSVTSLPRAESPTTTRPSVLADRATSGIQKKQKNDKISRAQRLRQQKGMDRAEAVMDQLEIKKAKSVARGKTVNSRRADWEDTNRKTLAFSALQQDDDDEDDEDDEAMAEDSAPTTIAVAKNVFQIATEDSNPAIEDTNIVDEADEIT